MTEKNAPVQRKTAPTETSTSDAPKRQEVEEEKPQSYVWLANGDVVRAFDEDLPGSAGGQNPHGHWQVGNKVYNIVAVHPVETEVKD